MGWLLHSIGQMELGRIDQIHPSKHTVLKLTEYTSERLPRTSLPDELGTLLWRNYSRQVLVEFPSPKTDEQWQLTALGWAGIIPLSAGYTVLLQPRVPLATLWSMIAYAFELPALFRTRHLVGVASLPDLYDGLAAILARRVLVRCRQGIYHAYRAQSARLPAVRGRVALDRASRTPWEPHLFCHYEEQTPDVEDNQILAWTLGCILRSQICTESTQTLVQQALLALRPVVTLRPVSAAACLGRHYDRLNGDYRSLHALCHFVLTHTTPVPAPGESPMLPFCIQMATLFERFVAAWLTQHLDHGWQLQVQERHLYDAQENLAFTIDLVIRDTSTGAVRWVLDTKYKTPATTPAAEDIAQVVTYAEATGATEAILVYPTPLVRPLDAQIGQVRVRSLAFRLDTAVEEAGQRFLAELRQG